MAAQSAGGNSAARVDLATLIYPDLGETEHEAAKQTQGESGLGIADPTLVFAQGHIQSVMQTALDDPIATPSGITVLRGPAQN